MTGISVATLRPPLPSKSRRCTDELARASGFGLGLAPTPRRPCLGRALYAPTPEQIARCTAMASGTDPGYSPPWVKPGPADAFGLPLGLCALLAWFSAATTRPLQPGLPEAGGGPSIRQADALEAPTPSASSAADSKATNTLLTGISFPTGLPAFSLRQPTPGTLEAHSFLRQRGVQTALLHGSVEIHSSHFDPAPGTAMGDRSLPAWIR